jgi:hypothetical protein
MQLHQPYILVKVLWNFINLFYFLENQFLQADGSHRTGCFDLTCPGFIQTSNEIALGAAIYPISIPGGLPYQIIICIYKVRHIYMMYNHVFKSHTPTM